MAAKTRTKNNRDHYQEITDRLISILEEAIDLNSPHDWVRPWASRGISVLPYNGVSGRRYRGINVVLLMMDPRNASDPRWMTYKQAEGKGWQVRRGEKSTTVYLSKKITVDDEDDDGNKVKKQIPLLRSFNVFHASQVDGIPALELPEPTEETEDWEEHVEAERLLKESNATVNYGGDRAFYMPVTDEITLPPRDQFRSAEGFYATAFHELGHWTKGAGRVERRKGVGNGVFGSEGYAREEIRVEFASSIVCGVLGIGSETETGCNDVAYIKSWIKALKNDKYEARRAAADAQKIADFVLGEAPEGEEGQES